MRHLSALFGEMLLLFGLVGAAISILAIIDPVGTQMSAAADPLGTPPGTGQSVAIPIFHASLSILAVFVLVRSWISKGGSE